MNNDKNTEYFFIKAPENQLNCFRVQSINLEFSPSTLIRNIEKD